MHIIKHTGKPYPLGIEQQGDRVNFALFSKTAQQITLGLFEIGQKTPFFETPLDPTENRTGTLWHIALEGLSSPFSYGYKIIAPTTSDRWLSDPYCLSLDSEIEWGREAEYAPVSLFSLFPPFDWQGVKKPQIPLNDLIVYEMHVRGFTQDPSSKVRYPGTFLGIIEKIPYLKDLGINAIELLPIQEFNENEYRPLHPIPGKTLYNYWGYSTVNFFSPMNRYAATQTPASALAEFKTMVRELHRAEIEVILDVVFNHTAEGNERGPTLSFKGLENDVYYMLDYNKHYQNFSGCGNTLNCNHPVVQELIIAALRYWVIEMGVDGFRFDLATILNRDIHGALYSAAPLVDAISQDPVLATTKLISEPWDAVGGYQVGGFYPQEERWAEWNGKFRDHVRRFIKGDRGLKGRFATRLAGSQDLYQTRSPLASLNFVTAHDGFTLHDLVSYNVKHNSANGENNQDGSNNNDSWNCGNEGPTDEKSILKLREKQKRNFLLVLFLAQGIPMLHMGDEYGHTKLGNNNTWCQDNPLNWFD